MPDLRLPVGLFFLLTGAVLVAQGLIDPQVIEGMRVDLDWGALLVIFGAAMTYFGWKAGPDDADHRR